MTNALPRLPLVSIICPMHNEANSIEALHSALIEVFANHPQTHFEVVCIDDGSNDHTLSLLIRLNQHDARFKVVELSRRFGKEAALTAGMDNAIGDAVIPFDADLQDPPELIPKMIKAWQAGAEVVLAKRVDRTVDSLAKRITASWFYRLHNQIAEVAIPENVGDFRLMDHKVVQALKLLPEQQRFMKGLFAWVGFSSVTIEYTRKERQAGKTKFSAWNLWNFAIEGITSFSAAPLKIWTYVGLAGALISFLYASFIVLRTILFGIDVPGYASLLVAILFLGSLQLISVGMLGEYIGRIYMETKRRPSYLIRNTYGVDMKDASQ